MLPVASVIMVCCCPILEGVGVDQNYYVAFYSISVLYFPTIASARMGKRGSGASCLDLLIFLSANCYVQSHLWDLWPLSLPYYVRMRVSRGTSEEEGIVRSGKRRGHAGWNVWLGKKEIHRTRSFVRGVGKGVEGCGVHVVGKEPGGTMEC